jgi:hypothetical protein
MSMPFIETEAGLGEGFGQETQDVRVQARARPAAASFLHFGMPLYRLQWTPKDEGVATPSKNTHAANVHMARRVRHIAGRAVPVRREPHAQIQSGLRIRTVSPPMTSMACSSPES